MLDAPNRLATRRQRVRYLDRPDYARPLLELPPEAEERMLGRLRYLYGDAVARETLPELRRILQVHHAHKPAALVARHRGLDPTERFTEQDLVLITYGDLVHDGRGRSPLATLAGFLHRPGLRSLFNTIHLLPFFPYSSDRGFSITDFRSVDPALGTWADIDAIGEQFHLMFDGVLNHVSAESRAFQEFLDGNPEMRDLVIWFRSPDEISPEQRRLIRRPRTSDILTRFDAIHGPVWVWTTFSPDQVDLNYKNPRVLLRTIDTMLLYARRGADVLRLDAVTYLWDELGTTCASLEQTHQIIKLLRDVVDVVAPDLVLLTETNVPHEENVSYFGDGSDEAHMVYNFALPPLTLHAFYRGDASHLAAWADGLAYPSDTTSYLNVLDTHDGIGVLGARGILPEEEIAFLVETARDHGGYVSYRSTGDGQEGPYEINTTWWSALNRTGGDEDLDLQVRRFVASRSVALAIRGVPGMYFHGVVGTENDPSVVERTGHKRDINRVAMDAERLIAGLDDPASKLSRLRERLGAVVAARVSERAFHPDGAQRVLRGDPSVFAVLRTAKDGSERVLAVTNVTGHPHRVEIPVSELAPGADRWVDLLCAGGAEVRSGVLSVALEPYGVRWLKPAGEVAEMACEVRVGGTG